MQRAFGIRTFRAWHKAALKARNGKLSVDAAREVSAQGVSDVFTAANIESLPSASIKSWCEMCTVLLNAFPVRSRSDSLAAIGRAK